MKAVRIASAVLSVCIVLPIWFYLLYKVLQSVNATEVMWLLYWIYLPIGIIVSVLQKVIEAESR